MDKLIKSTISGVGGILAVATKQYGLILALLITAILFDFVTGLIKAKVVGEKLDSRKGTIGFWKKIALLVAFGFGIFLDYFIPTALQTGVNITLPFDCPFALIIGVYIIINESISICENLYLINPTIIPKWVVNLLKKASTDIDVKDIKEEK